MPCARATEAARQGSGALGVLVPREQIPEKEKRETLKSTKPKAKKQTYFPGCLSVLGACLGSFLRDKTNLVVPRPLCPQKDTKAERCGPWPLATAALCGPPGSPRPRGRPVGGCGAVGSSCPRGGPGAQVEFYKKQIYGEVSERRWWEGVPAFIKEGALQGDCSEQAIKSPRPGWPELPFQPGCTCSVPLKNGFPTSRAPGEVARPLQARRASRKGSQCDVR